VSFLEDLETLPKFKNVRDVHKKLERIPVNNYKNLHNKIFTETSLGVDVDKFNEEVLSLKPYFQQWGITHTKEPRYGLALTRPKKYKYNIVPEPANWPMDVYLWNYPNAPLFDVDFTEPTEYVERLTSLHEFFDKFQGVLGRVNIIWWNNTAGFRKHKDVNNNDPINFRLWMGNKTGSNKHSFKVEDVEYSDQLKEGKIYLFDSSLMHTGKALCDNCYIFFVSLLPKAYDKIREIL